MVISDEFHLMRIEKGEAQFFQLVVNQGSQDRIPGSGLGICRFSTYFPGQLEQ